MLFPFAPRVRPAHSISFSFLPIRFPDIMIGVASVLAFGNTIQSQINLNFNGFDWLSGESSSGAVTSLPGWAQALDLIVVIFPALDTLSVFPLIAITLADNLAAALPITGLLTAISNGGASIESDSPANQDRSKMNAMQGQRGSNNAAVETGSGMRSGGGGGGGEEEEAATAAVANRANTAFWRLVAAIPPMAVAAVTGDLSTTLSFAGIGGIAVAFITPALLQRSSWITVERQGMSARTPFCFEEKSIFHRYFEATGIAVWSLLVFSVFALAVVVWQIAIEL